MTRVLLLTLIALFSIHYSNASNIRGTIKDATTREPIIGATIIPEGAPSKATVSGVDGKFEIKNLASLPIVINISFIGYKPQVVTVNSENPIEVLLTSDLIDIGSVAVVGRKKTGSEAGMVATLKNLHSVSVGVAGTQIAKSSDADAGEVVKRIPGISLVDNRFIIIRGLSQRYNNVWINGGGVPSSEADGRAFSFDAVPSSNIENILITKSYSADLPGDFCGGFIKITTKGMPEKNSFQIGIGTGINTGTHFADMKSSAGSSTDWLGFDGSKRTLSGGFPSHLDNITDNKQLDHFMTSGFNNDWSIKNITPLPDIKLNAQWDARFNKEFGMITAIGYSNTNKSYTDIENNRYGIYNSTNDTPTYEKQYTDDQYTNDVKVNIMNNWIWEPSANTKYEFRNLFNLMGKNRLTERYGLSTVSGEYYERQTEFLYQSRLSYTGQFAGVHNFGEDKSQSIDWNATYSYASKDEPDRRIIKNIGTVPADRIITPDLPSYNDQIQRYFQELGENIVSTSANYKKVFSDMAINPTLKAGVYGEYRTRSYTPREFIYRYDRLAYDKREDYINLPFEQMMDLQWIGSDKVYIDEISRKSNAYDGDYSIGAAYVAATLPIGKFTIDAGVRAEMWNMSITYDRSMSSSNELITKHKYDKLSFLPALNVAYNFNKKSLMRFSYGRTVNRPEFREVSPAVYYDFDLFAEVQGNTDLKMATIDNLDLRYEFYPSSGEMITFGAFYKHFTNPIEWNFVDMGGTYRYSFENARSAYTAGIEIDIRKSLDFINLPQLSLVFNGALVKSSVKFRDSDLVTEKDRPLQGQSPYIVNAGLYYTSNEKLGLSVSLLYNIIGKRIIGVGKTSSVDGNTDFDVPDSYEMPRNMIDLTVSKRLGKNVDMKIGIKDILNQPIKYKQFPTTTINGAQVERSQNLRYQQNGTNVAMTFTFKFK